MNGVTVEASFKDGSRHLIWAPSNKAVVKVMLAIGELTSFTVAKNHRP